MPDIKLCYFNSRGFAEVSRLVLALADKEFEDLRWSREEWPQYKPEAPLGQGPYLVYDGKKIGQSSAIACFLAREFGLYGKDNFDAAVIDQVIGVFKDLAQAWGKARGEEDPAKKEELEKKLKDEDFHTFFGRFQTLLAHNTSGSGLFVGDSITLADLYVFDLMFQIKKIMGLNVGDKFPALQALYDKVNANPKISAWVAKRPDTEM